ncbi:MAG: hypothetical protein V4685_09835 [Bacteroidota bacterium]
MSENTHIDKIFKDGIGDMKFSNADAMWQSMEVDLDKEKGKKKRPVIFFIALAVLLTAGVFSVKHFNQPAVPAIAEAKIEVPTIVINEVKPGNKNISTQQHVAVVNDASKTSGNNLNNNSSVVTAKQTATDLHNNNHLLNSIAPADFKTTVAGEIADAGENIIAAENEVATNDIQFEKTNATAELMTAPNATATIVIKPVSRNINIPTFPVEKKQIAKAHKISIEAVGGGDLLRVNRKAGFYAGIRLNKHLDKGGLISIGVNYASHTVLDRYRVANKPMDRGWYDAVVNNMSSVRVPIYLQRQMANSKFAMMIGLVPTYITAAEVYNVPDSYIGDPNPYRKFTLNDFNRFNLLFGAGLKYTPVTNGPFNRLSFELSGSYSFTGLVKDGYKNWSRVNDNFKSIQLGVAFKLK